MAICTFLDGDVVTLAPVQPSNMADCAGPVLLSSAEYVHVSVVPTFSQVFSVPTGPEITALWLAGFTVPFIGAFAAWAVSMVVDMFKGT